MKLYGTFFELVESLCSEDKVSYTVLLHPEHFIFQAHFPGNPITPGVCMIQMSEELLEMFLKVNLYLRSVRNIKFMKVLSPKEDTCVDVDIDKITRSADGCKASVVIHDSEHVYAKMSLIFGYE